MEKLIRTLELGKPTFDGQDTNYDIATIDNAITIIKKYVEIKKIVDKFNSNCDSSRMVERAYAEYTKIEKIECFERILDIFNEVA